MNIFGLGMQELLLIFFIVLLLFGARRLPEAGAGLGKAIRSFKEALTSAGSEKDEAEKKSLKP